MIRIIRSEWRKLRRPTLFLGTIVAVVGLSALFSALLFLLIDSPDGNSDRGRVISREALALPQGVVQGFTSVAGLLGIIALCVFAAQTSQEYTYGTLRNLLVRQPRRVRLLMGKHLAMSIFALVIVFLSALSSITAQRIFAPGKNVSTQAWFGADGRHFILQALLNVLLSTILYGTVGMVLGIVLRSPISAISLGVIWLLIVETLLTVVRPSTEKWLPGALMSAIGQGGTPTLEYQRSLVVALIYVTSAALISGTLFYRRDVSN